MQSKSKHFPRFLVPYYTKKCLKDGLSLIAWMVGDHSLEKSTSCLFNGVMGERVHKRKLLYSLFDGARRRDLSTMNEFTDFGLLWYNWIMQLEAGDIVAGIGAFKNTDLEIISITPDISTGWHSFFPWRFKNAHKTKRVVNFTIKARIVENYNKHLPSFKDFPIGAVFTDISAYHIFPVHSHEISNTCGGHVYWQRNGHSMSNDENAYTNSQEYMDSLKQLIKDK